MLVNNLIIQLLLLWGFPGGASGKESACQCRRPKGCVFNPWVRKIHSLEEKMATHPSILAWKTPWTEEPGRLQLVGSQRVWHSWAHTPLLGEAKGMLAFSLLVFEFDTMEFKTTCLKLPFFSETEYSTSAKERTVQQSPLWQRQRDLNGMESIQPPEERLEVSVKMKAWEKLGTKTRVRKIPTGLAPIQLAAYTSADFFKI